MQAEKDVLNKTMLWFPNAYGGIFSKTNSTVKAIMKSIS